MWNEAFKGFIKGCGAVKWIVVRYRRPKNRTVSYRQVLLYEDPEVIVSVGLMEPPKPLSPFDGGCLAIWFNFPSAWHNVGVVHEKSGRLRGYYCDILTPIRRFPGGLRTTDLFLDLWVFPDGRYAVLDVEEFDEAVKRKWMGKRRAERARRELKGLVVQVEHGRFPPALVQGFLAKASGELGPALEALEKGHPAGVFERVRHPRGKA